MERVETLQRKYYDCDGCGYVLGTPMIRMAVPFAGHDEEFVFHFHAPTHPERHDCFRYWAHSPHVMRTSLVARKLLDGEVDEFMRIMLYRDDNKPWVPGVARKHEQATGKEKG